MLSVAGQLSLQRPVSTASRGANCHCNSRVTDVTRAVSRFDAKRVYPLVEWLLCPDCLLTGWFRIENQL